MKTLRTVALTILTLIPTAELLFLPLYLAHRTSSQLNQFTGSYTGCSTADSECSLAEAMEAAPWR